MVELLAPVRDLVSLSAAIKSGANSVYFGVGVLNMRASSKGIEINKLPGIVANAHKDNVKVYITLNVLVYEDEFKKIDEILFECKKAGIDAVICWDPAMIMKCKMHEIPFHISTQANISNSASAQFYKDLGANCIVLARECTLEQIRKIRRKVDIKIESFVHGALCVSISGRCYMSQFVFCESANRGECIQPCRREYRIIDKETNYELEVGNGYVMSPKDLCTIGILDKMIESGIDIFKIEGRSRSPEYISTIVKAYRRAIDAYYENKLSFEMKKELIEEVSKVYNRGFSEGFMFGKPGKEGWANIDNSIASKRKVYIGKVINYYTKHEIVYINVESSYLTNKEVIQIHGITTGVVENEINELRKDNIEVVKVERGEATFPFDKKVRKNDIVYKIIDSL